MISVEEDFEAYKEWVTRFPDSFVLDVYVGNEIHKWHCARKDSFYAVCTVDGKFKRFIHHLELQ
jgi:hypothetical protein